MEPRVISSRLGFPNLFENIGLLSKPFSTEEIKKTLFEMASLKSLGLDGFHVGFN